MRVAVAMSGGVDSSFAALRLRDEGHEVTGLTAWLWKCGSPRLSEYACCGSVEGLRRARAAADALGIEHHIIDLSREFEECVVKETARAYSAGLTPNPCALCNSRVRFPLLAEAARAFGAEALATGHYAKLLPREAGGVRLLRGRDPAHDQSYFLFAVAPETLAYCRFPLADETKDAVRAATAAAGHPAAAEPASQDMCFSGEGGLAGFMKSRVAGELRPGPIVHVDGRVVGEHGGLATYTVGQRKGIGVAWKEPLYVVELRPGTNELVVGPDEALLRDSFAVLEVAWLTPGVRVEGLLECRVQIRYRMKAVPARVTLEDDSRGLVELADPVRAVAPGQAAVFYAETPEGEEVLGGGWIAG